MAELPQVVPGEPVQSTTFGNPVIERVISRYTDATARDFQVPLPQPGDPAYLTATDEFQIYDGTTWVTFGTAASVALKVARAGDTMTGALTILSNPAEDLKGSVNMDLDGSLSIRMRESDASGGWALNKQTATLFYLWDYQIGNPAWIADAVAQSLKAVNGYDWRGPTENIGDSNNAIVNLSTSWQDLAEVAIPSGVWVGDAVAVCTTADTGATDQAELQFTRNGSAVTGSQVALVSQGRWSLQGRCYEPITGPATVKFQGRKVGTTGSLIQVFNRRLLAHEAPAGVATSFDGEV